MKAWKVSLIALVVLLALAGCISIPIGDGSSMKISTDGITIKDENDEEHSINIDKDEGEITFEGFGQEDGSGKISIDDESGQLSFEGETQDGEEYSMSFGADVELPSEFPSDFPIADDAEIISSTMMNNTFSVMYLSQQSMDSLTQMYQDYMNNNIKEGSPEMNKVEADMGEGKMTMNQFTGETTHGKVSIMITDEPNTDGFQVMLYIE